MQGTRRCSRANHLKSLGVKEHLERFRTPRKRKKMACWQVRWASARSGFASPPGSPGRTPHPQGVCSVGGHRGTQHWSGRLGRGRLSWKCRRGTPATRLGRGRGSWDDGRGMPVTRPVRGRRSDHARGVHVEEVLVADLLGRQTRRYERKGGRWNAHRLGVGNVDPGRAPLVGHDHARACCSGRSGTGRLA